MPGGSTCCWCVWRFSDGTCLYTTTRYRSPEALKVEWYCQGVVDAQSQKKLDALMEQLRLELFPEMEEVTFHRPSPMTRPMATCS